MSENIEKVGLHRLKNNRIPGNSIFEMLIRMLIFYKIKQYFDRFKGSFKKCLFCLQIYM